MGRFQPVLTSPCRNLFWCPDTHISSVTYSKLLGTHFQDIEDNGIVALAGIVAALALQRV